MSVSVLLYFPRVVVLAVLKLAVIPLGSPRTENVGAVVEPLPAVVLTVTAADAPGATLALAELAASVSAGAATDTVTVAVRLNPPPEPITAIGKLPVAAVAAAAIVKVTGLPALALDEENVTVTPAGAPAAESVTGVAKPFCGVRLTPAVIDEPCETVTLAGLAESVKFEARPLLQLLTSRNASTDPSPVTGSYPVPAV